VSRRALLCRAVRVDVCVPTASVTDNRCTLAPDWLGRQRPETVPCHTSRTRRQACLPINWPLPAGPQVDANRTMLNSVGLVPPSVACAIPVSVAFPCW